MSTRNVPPAESGEPLDDQTMVEDPRPGSRGSTRIPSADDVLVAASELVLAGAGLPKAAVRHGHAAGTGFLVAPVTWAAHPRAAVTWYEEGEPTCGTDGPAGKLRDCEQALRRAGFHVEHTTEATGGRLLA
jgi:hypothetical protein